jgi:hypothetical protein
MRPIELNREATAGAQACMSIHNVLHNRDMRKKLSMLPILVAVSLWAGFGVWYYRAERHYLERQYIGSDLLAAFETVGKATVVTNEKGVIRLSTESADKLFGKLSPGTNIMFLCPQIKQSFDVAVRAANDSRDGCGVTQLVTNDCMLTKETFLQVTVTAVKKSDSFTVVLTALPAKNVDAILLNEEAMKHVVKSHAH